MPKSLSCGVVMLNTRGELLLCHATGTPRWDIPKGMTEPGESALETAVRETWEETSLAIAPGVLHDLGAMDYLPAKRLHLFAVRVAADAFAIANCRCHTSFPHRISGAPTLEVDAHAWVPLQAVNEHCGKNLARVLNALDWGLIEQLPAVATVAVIDVTPP